MKPPIAMALLGAVWLTGCAAPSLPQLRAQAEALRAQRSIVPAHGQSLAGELADPVDADRAVRIALLNNPGVRATMAQLQAARGDLVDALRPANPVLDIASLDAAGGVTRVVWSVSQPLLDLMFSAYRREHGELAMREAQHQVADQLLRLERDVRQAWLAHAAAALRLRVAQRAVEASALAAELAHAYHAAGNVSELQWRAEQALASESQLQLAARESARLVARTTLLDLMGLRHDQQGLQFDERLVLPALVPPDADALAAQALEQRLDLAARSSALEIAQREARHTRRWRWLPGAELRIERERETGAPTMTGVGAALQLPVADTGAGRLARATSRIDVRSAELEALQLAVQNRIAQHAAQLAIAGRSFDVHARGLMQQNLRMLELAGEQHNFMLIGSFELLATRRRQIEGLDLWIDAVESWWHVFNDLSYEAGQALPVPASTGYISAEELP